MCIVFSVLVKKLVQQDFFVISYERSVQCVKSVRKYGYW